VASILETIVNNLYLFPEVDIKSKLSKKLLVIYPEADERRYIGACLIISLILSILLFILSLLLLEEMSLLIFPVSFLLFFLFLLALPTFELSRRSKIIEVEMPFMLRTVGMLINMKIPFTKALAIVSEENNEIGKEMRRIVRDVNSGVTIEKAFARFAVSFDSQPVKRAISQLLSAYEIGGAGNEMKRIGDELLAMQQHSLKEHASKSAIFGMLFIMTVAILPTFFLVYVLLGKFGVGGAISEFGIAITLLLVFPAISVFLLLLSKASVPHSPFSQGQSVLDVTVAAPAFLFLFAFLFLEGDLRLFIVVIATAMMLFVVYKSYIKEKRTEEIEQYLPDALFTISALPKSAKMEKIFETIENGGYGALSEEAGKSKRQLLMNVRTDVVLEDLWKRNDSQALKRASTMLKHVFDTNAFSQMHSIAEDLLKNFEIKRERASLMSMQKYTILFGGILIPIILKMALSLISGMVEFFGDPTAPQLISYTVSIIPAYLVMYSLISAFYVADIEGRKSRVAIYFLLLAVVSILLFTFLEF